jgi:TP901 family phage tail tape measure protein
MADTNANIRIDVETSEALSKIKQLQRQISVFHSDMAKGGAAAAAASSKLQNQLVNSIKATGAFSAEMTKINSTSESFTNALEKNKLSMGQYFRYAGASTKTFGSLFKSEFNTINKVARERVKDLQTQYIKMGRDANGSLSAIKVRPLALDMNNLGTQVAMAAQKQQIFNQLITQGSTNLLNWGKNTQWAGRQLMVGFTIPLSIMGTVAAKEFMKLEKQAIRFRRVYGEMFTTSAETEKAISTVRELADEFTKYGVAVEKTMELAADAAQMGLMGAALTAQVTQATRLAVLGEVEQQEALQATISVTNAFGVAAEDLAAKIDFLNAVENQTMVAISDLTEAIPKAGPVVKQLGGDVEDLAFFLSAMREGGINASEGANALKSGLASLINPSTKATEMLNGFGISIKGIVESNAGDIQGTVIGVAQALDTLDPLNRARAIEELFGKFQFARMSTLFQNVIKEGSQASRVLDLTRASAEELAVLSERELKNVENSPVFKFEKAIENIKTKLAPIGEAFLKAITPIIEFGSQILDKFNNMSDGAKQFIVVMAGISGLVAPALLMVVGLMANGIANVIKFGQMMAKYFGMAGTQSQVLGEQTSYLTQQQIEQLAVAASLEQAHSVLTQAITSEGTSVNMLAAAYEKALVAQQQYANAARAAAASGAAGAAGAAASASGGKALGLASGIVSVPGPKGAGDVVPAMLSPGEAVIPVDKNKQYAALVQGIIAGNIPGFEGGVVNVGGADFSIATARGARGIERRMSELSGRSTVEGSQSYDTAFFLEALQKLAGEAVNTGEALQITSKQFEQMTQVLAEEKGMLAPARAHVTRDFDASDPRAQKALKDKGWDKLPKDYQDNLKFVSNLTAEVGQASNLRLRNGTETVEGFSKEWNGRQNKMLSAAKAGGLDIENQENLDAVKQLEKEIGERVVATAEATGQQTIHDNDLADATMAVIAQYENVEGALGDTARAWRVRADQVGEIRSSQGIDKIQAGLASGELQQRGQQVDYVDPKTGDVVKGIARMPDAQGSVYASTDVPGQPGGSYGNTPRRSSKVVEDAVQDAEVRNEIMEANVEDAYDAGRKGVRASPHPLAGEDGFDDQTAYNQGREKAGLTPPPPPPTAPTPKSGFMSNLRDSVADSKLGKAAGRGLAKMSGNAVTDSKGQVFYDPNQDSSTWAGKMTAENEAFKAKLYNREENLLTEQEALVRKEATVAEEQSKAAKETQQSAQQLEEAALLDKQNGPDGAPPAGAPGTKGRSLAGGVFALGSVAMGASMLGGPIGDVAGKIAAPLMAIGGIMPMLGKMPIQLQLVIVALGLLAFGIYKIVTGFSKTAKEMAKLETALGTGTEAVQKFAEFSGKVTSTEIMQRRREGGIDPFQVEPGKKTTGQVFFEGEQGAALAEAAKAGIEKFGKDATIKKIYLQLGQAVASGALDTASAMSIASEIGTQLGDRSFAISVNSQLLTLLDPQGTDLLVDPLTIQAKLLIDQRSNLDELLQETATSYGDVWEAGSEADQRLGEIITRQGGMIPAMLSSAEAWGIWWGAVTGTTAANENIERITSIITQSRNTLQNYQTSLDTISLEYEKKITDATARGFSSSEIDALREEELSRKQEVLNQREATMADVLAKRQEDAGRFDLGMKSSLSSIFEGTDLKAAESLFNQIGNVIGEDGKGLELRYALTTGEVPLGTIEQIVSDYDEFPNLSEKRISIITDFGTGFSQEVENTLAVIEDPALKQQYMALFDPNNLAASTDALNAVTDAARVASTMIGGDPSIILDVIINDEDARKRYAESIAKLEEDSANKVTFELDYVQTTFGQEAFEAATLLWDTIPPEERKDALFSILTQLDAVATDGYQSLLGQYGVAGTSIGGIDQDGGLAAFMAGSTSQYLAYGNAAQNSVIPEPPEDSGSGSTSSFLDGINKRLRDVRQNQILISEGYEKQAQQLEDLFGGDRGLSVFSGLKQDMRGLGAGEDLIDLIAGMPAEEFEKRKNELFNFDGAGNIAGFTDKLKSIGKALGAIALGDFENSQQQTVTTINNQITAIRKLTAAGMSQVQAYEAVQDAALASAIAQEQNVEVLKQLVSITDQATKMSEAYAAAQAVVRKNQETKDLKNAINYIQKNQTALTDAQRVAILEDPNLQALIGSDIDPKALQEALRNAEQQADLDLRIKKLTFEGRLEIFEEGFSKAMESFAVLATQTELEFDVKKEPFLEAVKTAQEQLSDIRDRPGGMDDLEADLQRISFQEEDINKKYDDRIKALDEVEKATKAINDLKKQQLTIADALSQGDIAAAARAAQELSDKQAADALQNQKDMLDLSRQREIDSLTGNNGQTRQQIEEIIRDLKMQILEIEEAIIEPAQYQVELLDREQQTIIENLEVLGKTKDEWERIKNGIDLAKISSDKYIQSIQNALDLVDKITDYWDDLDGRVIKTTHEIKQIVVRDFSGSSNNGQGNNSGSNNGPNNGPTPTSTAAQWKENMTAQQNEVAANAARGRLANSGPVGFDTPTKTFSVVQNVVSTAQKIVKALNLPSWMTTPLWNSGGLIPAQRFAIGGRVMGYAGGGYSMGSDTVSAMLTPGEFVIRKRAVQNFGVDNLERINSGADSLGSVYNYNLSVNVKSEADADQIARTVMGQIKRVDSQRIRGNRF